MNCPFGKAYFPGLLPLSTAENGEDPGCAEDGGGETLLAPVKLDGPASRQQVVKEPK